MLELGICLLVILDISKFRATGEFNHIDINSAQLADGSLYIGEKRCRVVKSE
jgi:hypothetical protein